MVDKSILILLLTGIVFFHPICQIKAQSSSVTIASKTIDINNKGTIDTVKIVLNSGRLLKDGEQWCGSGLKYKGNFNIVVYIEDEVRKQSLNKLMDPADPDQPLWFRASPFKTFPEQPSLWNIQFDDYNEDEQPDFTIGQYAGCNGWNYQLFTIDSTGTVDAIDFECKCYKKLFVNQQKNSVKLEKVSNGFAVSYYHNAKGRYRDTYRWLEVSGQFILEARNKIEN